MLLSSVQAVKEQIIRTPLRLLSQVTLLNCPPDMFSIRIPLPFFGVSDTGNTTEIELEPIRRERLGPADFLDVLESDSENIQSASFVSPRLGDDHFGYFEVKYRKPIYR